MKKLILCLSAVMLLSGIATKCYGDDAMESKIDALLKQMTLPEKIQLLSGDKTGFNPEGLERLGIPKMKMTDGPVGVRNGQSTAFPVSENLAATWDTELAHRYGKAVAEETTAKGKHVILGPCICIARFPLSGRNFENYGEDPYLTSRIAVNYIEGVQGEGVIATAKHYAANDQEWERRDVDVIIDERALREIHLPAFEAAVKEANVWAVMSAYNLINGQHASENKHLLTDVLKNEWGFDGIVMSDWVSVYSAVDAANNGLDLEMPNGMWFGNKLLTAVNEGKVSEATIDDKVRRLLRVRFKAGVFDNPNPKEDPSVIRSDAHRRFALKVAQESIVLLKNDGVLPLDKSKLKKIAVIGPNAKVARTGGGGSAMVDPWHVISPLEGIINAVGQSVEVGFASGADAGMDDYEPIPGECLKTGDPQQAGLRGEYFDNSSLTGEPEFVRVDKEVNFSYGLGAPSDDMDTEHFSIRWSGMLVPKKSGAYRLGVASDDSSMLYIDDQLVVENGGKHAERFKACKMDLVAGKSYPVRLEFDENGGDASVKLLWKTPDEVARDGVAEAVALAKESDVAIICAGNTFKRESEGLDVAGFTMEGEQDGLIAAVAAANPRTIVVLNGGTPIDVRAWVDEVEGLIAAFYPGQEGGEALADIVFGDVNPSAKLPFSYIQAKSDTYAFDGYQDPSLKMPYKEGVFVGYRYYDKNGINPLFEFGYGLSYTTFEYSGLKVEKTGELEYTVSAEVKNTGKVAGAEIVQLYIGSPASKVERPVKELKGFAKVRLEPGQSKTVRMVLSPRSFQYYDVDIAGWTADPGAYEVMVGASSRDIKLRKTVRLSGE